MKKISLLEQNLILSIRKGEKIIPFFAISTPDENNIYVNYLLIGKHLTLHASRAPFIKRVRDNYTKNNMYERKLCDFSKPEAHEIIEGYSFSYDLLDREEIKSFTEGQMKIFDSKENNHLWIYAFEELEKSGWQKGGLGIQGVLLPASREPESSEIKNIMKKYLSPKGEKETSIKCKFSDKCLLLSIYNDEVIAPSSYSLGTHFNLNMKTTTPGAELIIKIPKKWNDDIITKNAGWTRIEDKES